MSTLPVKSLKTPDHIYTMPKLKVEMVEFGEAGTLARFTYEPGFHYAEHVTPNIGTAIPGAVEEVPSHVTLVLSGRLHSVLPDGAEHETGPGDASLVPGWHGATRDAWVVGEEPFILITFLPGRSALQNHS